MRRHVNQQGFSLVEVLLAAAVFGVLTVGLIGAFIYGQQSTVLSGDRDRALFLADEGLQATRNIGNASFANLTVGTHGLEQAAGVWAFSGTSDTTGVYTRQVTITSGINRASVTSTVQWTSASGITRQVSTSTMLTNWTAIIHSWTTPVLAGSIANAGFKVATQGDYAYIVRNTAVGPNFIVVNVSNKASPSVVGTLTIAGTPTNVAVSGNYAYVSNSLGTAEFAVVNVTNPAAPTVSSTYNAAGTAGGLGVAVNGNYAYLSRAANGGNDELVIINVTNPAAPTRVFGFNLNASNNEVYVNGTTIYVATSSNTQEVVKYTALVFGSVYSTASLNLPTNTDAATISGNGDTIFVGQGTSFRGIDGAALTLTGSVTAPGTINDVSPNPNGQFAFIGMANNSGEFGVVSTSNLSAPTITATVNVAGNSSITGVSYDGSYDISVGVGTSATQSTAIFSPN